MKIGLAQINTTVGDINGNRDRVVQALGKARESGAAIAVFPELCLTGYPPRDLLGLHGFVEANIRAVHEIAAHSGSMAVVVGFVDRNPQKEGRRFYNAAAFLAEGKLQAVVHKTLLPTYDVFDEDRYFESAKSTQVVPFRGQTLGISICEDAWNSEAFWSRPLYSTDPIRNQVERGATLLINISASPYEIGKPRLRFEMLSDHVQKHRVPLLYVNLVGGNDDLLFDGNSLALGKNGNVIAQGRSFAEDFLIVDTESTEDRGYREGESLENLYQALVMGTRDYARKCGFRSAVLGLSGGIDSSIVACIAVAALGAGNVLGVSMPSMYSAQASFDDAQSLARNLGMHFETIPIKPIYDMFRQSLTPIFSGLPENETEENLQARIRGTLLMALSNKFGHLVLSTGNKSEVGAGYCTLYGDMVGGLAVISDVPKTMIYRLAAHINSQREIIPRNTIERPPSAELKPNQTDQDTLPEYDILDGILKSRVEEQKSIDEIVAQGFDQATVERVVRMIQVNEYKRRQAAIGLKVTTRAFGPGRRMPIAMRLGT
ncbi:MAG TPA: NAD+ synthase [Acidobacteriota bacterium]|nr:NAD+ synthase [Acidobacteriota bacterium]